MDVTGSEFCSSGLNCNGRSEIRLDFSPHFSLVKAKCLFSFGSPHFNSNVCFSVIYPSFISRTPVKHLVLLTIPKLNTSIGQLKNQNAAFCNAMQYNTR